MSHRSLALLLLILAGPLPAATFTVNSISDNQSGDSNPGDNICEDILGGSRCTLRAAIEEANADPINDVIEFSIGNGISIPLQAPLPVITSSLIIDATTAPGYNTAATTIDQAPPQVYLNGASLPAGSHGLHRNGTGVFQLRGLGLVGFSGDAVRVVGNTGPVIDRCWIGLGGAGAIAGNGRGIFLNQVDNAAIGRYATSSIQGFGNLVSGNLGHGIHVLLGDNNRIGGNRIGTTPDGGGDRGNGGDGIRMEGVNAIIGGNLAGVPFGNEVAFNDGRGVHAPLGGQRIIANTVHHNAMAGIEIGGSGSDVGFTATNQGNRVFANGSHGILAAGAGSHSVIANEVYQNQGRGVYASTGANLLVEGNTVFDNDDDGIRVDGTESTVRGNLIGIVDGVLVGNRGNGIVVLGDNNHVLSNRIAGGDTTNDDGIDVVSGTGVLIGTNRIGVSGTSLLNIAGHGVRVRSGAVAQVQGNWIGRAANGINLEGDGARVCDNRIGVSDNGSPAGNRGEGIFIAGDGNHVGPQSPACPGGNHIGHSGSDGIEVAGDNNRIDFNNIGYFDGLAQGNGRGGVLIGSGIAGIAPTDNRLVANVIAHNQDAGVRLLGTAGTGNEVNTNFFWGNGGIGIDLGDDGITANDPEDADVGVNRLQNAPVLVSTSDLGNGMLEVRYQVDSLAIHSAYPLKVDLYQASPGDNRQGRTWLGRHIHGTPGAIAIATVQLEAGEFSGNLVATTFDSLGNSSEFSAALPYLVAPPAVDLFADGFE